MATAVLAVLFVGGLLAGARVSREAAPTTTAAKDSSQSAATVAYIARLNSDMNILDVEVYKRLDCKTRSACIDELGVVRGMADAVVGDALDSPPAIFRTQATQIALAGRDFVAQVDDALRVVEQPNGDFVRASAAPDIHGLDMAAGGVICWPKTPVAVEGGESPSGYSCR